MSRSFRDLLKFSAPVLLSAAMLSGCGSGSSGSANLTRALGRPAAAARHCDGIVQLQGDRGLLRGRHPADPRAVLRWKAQGNGAWIIPSGQTGVVDFGTPADAVKFSTKDNYTAAAAAAAAGPEATLLPRGSQKVDAPFDTAMYVRGNIAGDWPHSRDLLQEVSDNVLAVTIPIEPGDYQFKVADAGWTGATNCGGSDNPTPVTLGATLTLGCSNGSQNLGSPSRRRQLQVHVRRDRRRQGRAEGHRGARHRRRRWRRARGARGQHHHPHLREGRAHGRLVGHAAQDRQGRRPARRGRTPPGRRYAHHAHRDREHRHGRRHRRRGFRVDREPALRARQRQRGHHLHPAGPDHRRDAHRSRRPELRLCAAGQRRRLFREWRDRGAVCQFEHDRHQCRRHPRDHHIQCRRRRRPVYAISGSPTARIGTPGESGKPAALPRNANEVILFYKRTTTTTPAGACTSSRRIPRVTPGRCSRPRASSRTRASTRSGAPTSASRCRAARARATATIRPRSTRSRPSLGFIIHKGDTKDPGTDQAIRIAEDGNMVFVVSGVNDVSSVPPGSGTSLRISGAAAHWVNSEPAVDARPPAHQGRAAVLARRVDQRGPRASPAPSRPSRSPAGTNPQPAFNKQLHGLRRGRCRRRRSPRPRTSRADS